MFRLLKMISLLVLVSMTSLAHSQSDLAKKMMLKLQTDSTNWATEMIVEKVIPYSKTETILVLPESIEDQDRLVGFQTFLLIVDNTTGKIKQQLITYQESDAIALTGFVIDTAPYQLSSTTKAFGIRATYQNSSKPNPYSHESLSLFIRQGNTLKEVVKDLIVKQYACEWDTHCTGESTTEETIIILSEKSTNGYVELVLKKSIVLEKTFVNQKGECDSKSTKRTENSTMKYVNGCYH